MGKLLLPVQEQKESVLAAQACTSHQGHQCFHLSFVALAVGDSEIAVSALQVRLHCGQECQAD